MTFEGAQWVWWVQRQKENPVPDPDPGHLLPDAAWTQAQADADRFAAEPPTDALEDDD